MVPICPLVYGSTANDGFVLDKYFFAATTDCYSPSPFLQRGQTIRLNLTRIFRTARATANIPQTIIVQQFEIPSFFRRIAAEAIDSVIMFIFKFFLVYTLVRADLIELDTFDSILTANADLQTLIDVTQGLFSVELLFKLVTAIIEALCITFGVPVGCTPGKRLLGIKVVSCLDVQPVAGSPDRVAITGFAYVDFKGFFNFFKQEKNENE
ncbi:unnamed protein product [Meloidogyne enterolobii]|uniref:Uncharacterized protein n=1 Tax=Meloidogyne enterolobii TaxID=390850 RepID=A0ACB0YLP6_MELEN